MLLGRLYLQNFNLLLCTGRGYFGDLLVFCSLLISSLIGFNHRTSPSEGRWFTHATLVPKLGCIMQKHGISKNPNQPWHHY